MRWMLKLFIMIFLTFFSISHATFLIKVGSLKENTVLPKLFTCDGDNVSPNITWSNSPKNTQSFALIVSDPDAPSGVFYHWIVYNIPNNINQLPSAITKFPTELKIGINSYNQNKYNGPCPPKNTKHSYIFTLYALDAFLNSSGRIDANQLLVNMKNHIIDQTKFKVFYNR